MTTNILIMAHGLLYVDDHQNIMPFPSPSTTVVTIAPMARTSWSNLPVEYALLMTLHKNLKDPENADRSFYRTVRESAKESGVMHVLDNHKTHIPKSFGVQHDEIANKLMIFEDESETPDPYYGIWWLDEDESPLNLLAMPEEFHFHRIGDGETFYFSDIVETLQREFPGNEINILDYSCSSCLDPGGVIVANSDDRTVRRLSRGLKFPISPKVPKSPKSTRKRKRDSPNKDKGGTRKRRKSRS